MATHATEGEALWQAIDLDFRQGRSYAGIASQLGVNARTLTRWKKDGSVSEAVRSGVKEVLEAAGIDWRRRLAASPVYDFQSDYWENLQNGPIGMPTHPAQGLPLSPLDFFGKTIDSPIGISASNATAHSNWIRAWLDVGYTVITYKTVRAVSARYEPHPQPHIVTLPDYRAPMPLGKMPERLSRHHCGLAAHDGTAGISLANSVGMPSLTTPEWQADIRATLDLVGSRRALVVSVVGTGKSAPEIANNFVECAAAAAATKPDAIELNLSCPNIYSTDAERAEGLLYRDAPASARLIKAVRERVGATPILVKIGYMPPDDVAAFVRATRGLVAGYTAINTLARDVFEQGNELFPVFPRRGHNQSRAGISGIAIQEYALETIRTLSQLRGKKSDYRIIGVGGVSSPEDFLTYLRAGADVVQSCTAALFDRLLAVRARQVLAKAAWSSASALERAAPTDPSECRQFSMWYSEIRQVIDAEGWFDTTMSEFEDVVRLHQLEAEKQEAATGGAGFVRARTPVRTTSQYWRTLLVRVRANRR